MWCHRFFIVFLGMMGPFLLMGIEKLRAQELPGAMVEIAATIIEYRHNHEEQFGVFYQFQPNEKTDFGQSDLFLPGTEKQTDQHIPALNITGSFAEFKYGSIDFNVKTAIQEGWATVISNPMVLVADGESTSLSSGEEVPLTTLQFQGNKTRLELKTRKTGIKLNVTPRIFEGDKVLMNLEIESSEIIRFDVFDRGDGQRYELPVVSTRNIKSVVIVPSGRQLYIGGLYTDDTGDLTRKVPVAGDIPILGYFLRGFNKKKRRTETIFQIIPTIRKPGYGLEADLSVFSDLLETNSDSKVIQEQKLDRIPSDLSPQQLAPIGIKEPTGQAVVIPGEKIKAASPEIKPGTGDIPGMKEEKVRKKLTPDRKRKRWKRLILQ